MSVVIRDVKGRFGTYGLEGEPLKVPGRARIYRVLGSPDVLYKELGTALTGKREVQRIEELVRVGAEIGGPDLSTSRGRIAWPRDAVIDRGKVVGVITPYPGDEFYRESIGNRPMSRYLTLLRRPEAGVPVETRLRLMRQLAGVLALLEHVELVHGDVAPQNILWTLTSRPSIFLIDCDGMHSTAVEGSEGTTEGWTDPRKEAGDIASHDIYSDWFALALAIWRVTTLTPGTPEHGPREVILPPEIPAPFREPFVRTFEDVMDPYPRPSPGDWVKALDEVLGSGRARRGIDRLAPSQAPITQSAPAVARAEPTFAASPAPESPVRPGRRLRRGRILVRATILALVAMIGLSFLDSGPAVAQLRAEERTARWARAQFGVSRVDVVCPADSSLHAGARYVCRVETRNGAVARVRVAVKRGGTAERRLNLFAYRGRAIVPDLHAGYRYFRRQGLERGLKDVSCPRSVSANPGSTFTCEAEFTDGAKGKIVGRMGRQTGWYVWREAGTELGFQNYALS